MHLMDFFVIPRLKEIRYLNKLGKIAFKTGGSAGAILPLFLILQTRGSYGALINQYLTAPEEHPVYRNNRMVWF